MLKLETLIGATLSRYLSWNKTMYGKRTKWKPATLALMPSRSAIPWTFSHSQTSPFLTNARQPAYFSNRTSCTHTYPNHRQPSSQTQKHTPATSHPLFSSGMES
jgi:hypothetical protein